jgi:lipopolysaccharide transport system ATP-binding protein
MPVIEVNHVTKEFRLGQLVDFRQTLARGMNRLRGTPTPAMPVFRALDDIDFRVHEGEVMGIIGSNGAGKSTLLKILSRITTPTSGSLRVRQPVAPLIEVGAGLIGDLSGRENIYLNGAILGMPQREIRKKLDEIVAFAELEQFIDTPIKRFSSGMAVRLGFSIATCVDAGILIVDEVLAVGDLAFQRKCFDRMEDIIKRQGKTVLLVSHNIRQVQRLCTRVVLLSHGKILADGDAPTVCNLFYERSDERIKNTLRQRGQHISSGEIDLLDVRMINDAGTVTDRLVYREDVIVEVDFEAHAEMASPIFAVGVQTSDFVYLATPVTGDLYTGRTLKPGLHTLRCHIAGLPLLPGVYSLNFKMLAGEFRRTVFHADNVGNFQVRSRETRSESMLEGIFELDAGWELDVAQRQSAPASEALATAGADQCQPQT